MRKLLMAMVFVVAGCQGVGPLDNVKIPIADVEARSAEAIAALKLSDLNQDGWISGAGEVFTFLLHLVALNSNPPD